jgi:hypothetical protein
VEDSTRSCSAARYGTYSTVLYVSASQGDPCWRVKGWVLLTTYCPTTVRRVRRRSDPLCRRTTLLETTVSGSSGVVIEGPLGGGRLAQYVRGVAKKDVCRYNLKHTLLYL